MGSGGRTERRGPSRDRRASHPLSIGARMMVRVSERTFFNVNLGGIAEAMAFVPWGDEGYFLFPPPLLARRGSSAAQNIFLEEKNMKKHNTMKRLLAIAAAAALTLSLCACGPASEPGGPSSNVDGSAEPSQAVYSPAGRGQ